jgi:hypothetical protein
VKRAAILDARVRSLDIGELSVKRLRVESLAVTGRLELPQS